VQCCPVCSVVPAAQQCSAVLSVVSYRQLNSAVLSCLVSYRQLNRTQQNARVCLAVHVQCARFVSTALQVFPRSQSFKACAVKMTRRNYPLPPTSFSISRFNELFQLTPAFYDLISGYVYASHNKTHGLNIYGTKWLQPSRSVFVCTIFVPGSSFRTFLYSQSIQSSSNKALCHN
jgi:hypothetical protein